MSTSSPSSLVPSVDEIRAKVCAAAFGSPLVSNIYRGLVAEIIVGSGTRPRMGIVLRRLARLGFRTPDRLALGSQAIGGSANVDRDEKGDGAHIRYSDANRIFRPRGLGSRPTALRPHLCLRASSDNGRQRRSP